MTIRATYDNRGKKPPTKKFNCSVMRSHIKAFNLTVYNRGKTTSTKKFGRLVIRSHIETFNPTVSHYRNEHASTARYLTFDVTIQTIFDYFKLKYPELICSYKLYCIFVSGMNTSFTKLYHEECEMCKS